MDPLMCSVSLPAIREAEEGSIALTERHSGEHLAHKDEVEGVGQGDDDAARGEGHEGELQGADTAPALHQHHGHHLAQRHHQHHQGGCGDRVTTLYRLHISPPGPGVGERGTFLAQAERYATCSAAV